MLGLRSPSLDSALRASLWLSKIAPGDFVAMLTPTYQAFAEMTERIRAVFAGMTMVAGGSARYFVIGGSVKISE